MNDKLRAAAQAVAELLADAWIAELDAAASAPDVGDVAGLPGKCPIGDQHGQPVPDEGRRHMTTQTA